MYGLPSMFYQQIGLTPTNYFFGLIGGLLNIEDVLFLFKLSVLFDQLMLLIGIYLLSRVLFIHRITIILICLSAIFSTVWITQIYWNLQIVYLFPLTFYFIISFFQKRQPQSLWIAGIISILSLGGSVAYFAPLFLFIISILCFVFLLKYRDAWRCLFCRSYKNIIFFILFAVISSSFLYFVFNSQDFLTMYHAGRTDDLKISLESFLTHGFDLIKTFRFPEYISGMRIYHQAPVTVYIGLLPLVFFLLAFVKVRKISFIALSSATIALIWLSLGGFFSVVVYYLPTMSNFRHLGHIGGLIKIFILLCAGFGFDYFFTAIKENNFYANLRETKLFKTNLSLSHIIISILSLFFLIDIFFTYHINNISTPETKELDILSGILFGFRVIVYAIGIGLIYRIIKRQTPILNFGLRIAEPQSKLSDDLLTRTIKIIMLACFVIDILSFQIMAYLSIPKLPTHLVSTLDTLKANEIHFQEQRTNEPTNTRQKKALNLIKRDFPYRNVNMLFVYNFLQLDPCFPEFQTLFYPAGVDRLIRIRGGQPGESLGPSFLPQNDPSLLRVLGCNAPKLRLVSNAIFANNINQATKIIRDTPNLDNVVVLREKVISPLPVLESETISVDSSHDANFDAEKVVDKNIESFWETSNPFPHWIQYNYGEKIKITQYSLQTGSHGFDSTGRMPKSWQFQGSNDGVNWVTLDTRTDEVSWNNNEKRTYNYTNSTHYKYYRLYITNGVNPFILRLYEIELLEEIQPIQLQSTEKKNPIINGKLKVTLFTSNRLEVKAHVPTDTSAWLVYADSFHPGWHATVNGKETPILEANLAFKAVKLEKGSNIVRFTFNNSLSSKISVLFAIVSIIFSVLVVTTFLRVLFNFRLTPLDPL